MGLGVASLNLHLLLIGLQWVAVCSMMNLHHAHSSSSIKDSFFIKINELKQGTTKPFYLPKENPKSGFWPRDKADPIPFSSKLLPEILDFFRTPHGSALARTIEDTISICETRPIIGETKFCATSLESMLDFVIRVFEICDSPILLTSKFRHGRHREVYQNFTIVTAPREVSASKMVGCHTLPYPYAVLYCHTQEGGNKVYDVLLRGENGDVADTYVVCHLDTWQWDPNGPSFAALGTRPGTPVCHIFPPHGNFLWIYNNAPLAKI